MSGAQTPSSQGPAIRVQPTAPSAAPWSSVEAGVAAGRAVEALRTARRTIALSQAVNRADTFADAAQLFCSRLASPAGVERVSFGIRQGDLVRLCAISHLDLARAAPALARDIAAAMEECADQEVATCWPVPPTATFVARAAGDLADRHAARSVEVLPIPGRAGVAGVLLVERSGAAGSGEDAGDSFALPAALCAPRLLELFERERPFHQRMREAVRAYFGRLLGPTQVGSKLVGLALFGLLVLAVFGQTTRYADAPFELQAAERRTVVAPFDGYLASVERRVGDRVVAGRDVLGRLDTAELEIERARFQAEELAQRKQAAVHERDGNTGAAQISAARAAQAGARIELLSHRIASATMVAPIDGVIISGDLGSRQGSQLRIGDPLFEIAALDSLEALLALPEDRVPDVAVGQHGRLATASLPGRKLDVVVTSIEPVARTSDQRNVFRVRARVEAPPEWLRPGMRGVARLETGRVSHLQAWTGRLVNWFRMKLWI